MAKEEYAFDPQSGGRKIPDSIKPRVRDRILKHAEKHYAGKYNKIDVRFRNQFCYIDAYLEPNVPENFDPELYGGKSREERIEFMRNQPTYLCRIRFFGDKEEWSMAYYSYGKMNYDPCFFNDGSWFGTPEEAFDASAMYLD